MLISEALRMSCLCKTLLFKVAVIIIWIIVKYCFHDFFYLFFYCTNAYVWFSILELNSSEISPCTLTNNTKCRCFAGFTRLDETQKICICPVGSGIKHLGNYILIISHFLFYFSEFTVQEIWWFFFPTPLLFACMKVFFLLLFFLRKWIEDLWEMSA